MAESILITGGARSGKSSYAEMLARKPYAQGTGVLYIATAVASDEEMEDRIARHRAQRPSDWSTWECYKGLSKIDQAFDVTQYQTILIDCIVNLLANISFEEIEDIDSCPLFALDHAEAQALTEIDDLIAFAQKADKRLIFVTNEIGMGLVPEHRFSRYFRDALGRLNRHIADQADQVVLLVVGQPLIIKGGESCNDRDGREA